MGDSLALLAGAGVAAYFILGKTGSSQQSAQDKLVESAPDPAFFGAYSAYMCTQDKQSELCRQASVYCADILDSLDRGIKLTPAQRAFCDTGFRNYQQGGETNGWYDKFVAAVRDSDTWNKLLNWYYTKTNVKLERPDVRTTGEKRANLAQCEQLFQQMKNAKMYDEQGLQWLFSQFQTSGGNKECPFVPGGGFVKGADQQYFEHQTPQKPVPVPKEMEEWTKSGTPANIVDCIYKGQAAYKGNTDSLYADPKMIAFLGGTGPCPFK